MAGSRSLVDSPPAIKIPLVKRLYETGINAERRDFDVPALDNCHEQVVNALVKDGWRVFNLPRYMDLETRTIFIDIEATKVENGREQRLLLVEVKCFNDEKRASQDIYQAIGQYLIYRVILRETQEDDTLYLAVPKQAYQRFFDIIVKRAITETKIKLLIVNLDTETIEQWLE